jgi:hypothetical protein
MCITSPHSGHLLLAAVLSGNLKLQALQLKNQRFAIGKLSGKVAHLSTNRDACIVHSFFRLGTKICHAALQPNNFVIQLCHYFP